MFIKHFSLFHLPVFLFTYIIQVPSPVEKKRFAKMDEEVCPILLSIKVTEFNRVANINPTKVSPAGIERVAIALRGKWGTSCSRSQASRWRVIQALIVFHFFVVTRYRFNRFLRSKKKKEEKKIIIAECGSLFTIMCR